MKLTKLIIIFIVAFAVSISAQDEKPKIVWENLQTEYTKVEDIKSILVNKSESAIYIYPSGFYFAKLLRFNAYSKQWENQNPMICGFAAAEIKPYKFEREDKLEIDFFSENFYTRSPFMPSIETQEIRRVKYKFQVRYGFSKSKIDQISESPEFEFVEE